MKTKLEEVKELMNERGYLIVGCQHSNIDSPITCISFIKEENGVNLQADVYINDANNEIPMLELYTDICRKLFMTMEMGRTTYDHPDFRKFELIILKFTSLCNNHKETIIYDSEAEIAESN